ncbi:hypothetical protein GOARA_061_00060 [Gordonia araii NBRC 100433]|uniref:DUF1345 domain-containing protein n=1 Tax=Gordonia araii NBRC 100433 TaxID=1073574 RepID=G7H3Z2_9ACTN|nr:DUF1345 domain-containing protein [Gordonia araii]NNG96368.1 DUF1345 domain-containing protein [Gordonia araii NBRC 100433]GAB10567.1 hypothetical protein GOARA_061_00060 [Gordonia araii NBRC 100433]
MSRVPARGGFWVGAAAELAIIVASLVYVLSSEVWALITWEALAAIYLATGFALAWNGEQPSRVSRSELRMAARWSWALPLISSFAGVNSAVLALVARHDAAQNDIALSVAASIGVVLSWGLLNTGFAQMYEAADIASEHDAIEFPGNDRPVFLNYLYFSFTVGTSFATSDVTVKTLPARRLVLIHSVLSFFYNALVVAVAFQVLQHAVTT